MDFRRIFDGNFDGIHKGHVAVINKAKFIAIENKLKLITFPTAES